MKKPIPEMQKWIDGTVPDKVVNVVYFIWLEKSQGGVAPTWAEIAHVGGWAHRPRAEWQAKMRYLRRFGVEWSHQKRYSTRVRREVVPYLVAAADNRRDCREVAFR